MIRALALALWGGVLLQSSLSGRLDLLLRGVFHPLVAISGALLLGLYVSYLTYTVLQAAERPILHGYTTVMMWFVTPLVVLTLVSTVAYEVGRRRGASTAVG